MARPQQRFGGIKVVLLLQVRSRKKRLKLLIKPEKKKKKRGKTGRFDLLHRNGVINVGTLQHNLQQRRSFLLHSYILINIFYYFYFHHLPHTLLLHSITCLLPLKSPKSDISFSCAPKIIRIQNTYLSVSV